MIEHFFGNETFDLLSPKKDLGENDGDADLTEIELPEAINSDDIFYDIGETQNISSTSLSNETSTEHPLSKVESRSKHV